MEIENCQDLGPQLDKVNGSKLSILTVAPKYCVASFERLWPRGGRLGGGGGDPYYEREDVCHVWRREAAAPYHTG